MSAALLYMLDTDTVSYLVNARSPSVRRTYLETESQATIALSAITEGEIRFGLEKRPGATRLLSTFQEFFASVQVLPWTSEVAKAYGKLRAGLNATGRSLALMDLPHCLACDRGRRNSRDPRPGVSAPESFPHYCGLGHRHLGVAGPPRSSA